MEPRFEVHEAERLPQYSQPDELPTIIFKDFRLVINGYSSII
jgi:hypothetical protein